MTFLSGEFFYILWAENISFNKIMTNTYIVIFSLLNSIISLNHDYLIAIK